MLRRHGAAALPAVGTAALVAGLVVAPWIVRNHRVFGAWFFIKSNAGNELFIGNHPGATGGYVRSLEAAREVLPDEDFRRLRRMDEVAASRALGRYALDWIARNPGRFARLVLQRIRMFWTAPLLENWDLLPLGHARPWASRLYTAGRRLVLLAALLGALALARDREAPRAPLLFLGAYPIAYYATHADIARYRFPVTPFVLFLAAVGFAALARTLRRRGEEGRAAA